LGIVRFALKYPHTFYVVAVLILFLGVTAVVEMPTDIFPEIDIPVVSVIWQFTGLNTTEMEQRFTAYSQYAISSNVNGIKDIEAETVDGISVQKLYFQPDVNLSLASRRSSPRLMRSAHCCRPGPSRRSLCNIPRRPCRCCKSLSAEII
jgi:multidrug efflux pump subunit AcrB